MIDDHVTEIHHRHERLAAGKNLGVRRPPGAAAARDSRRVQVSSRETYALRRLDAELRLLLGISLIHARGDAVLGEFGREDAADFRLLVDVIDLVAAGAP